MYRFSHVHDALGSAGGIKVNIVARISFTFGCFCTAATAPKTHMYVRMFNVMGMQLISAQARVRICIRKLRCLLSGLFLGAQLSLARD